MFASLAHSQPTPAVKQNLPQALTPQAPLMPITTRAPIFYKQNRPVAMTEAKSLPLGVPAFKPIKTPPSLAIMDRSDTAKAPNTNNLQSVKQKLHQPVPGVPSIENQKNQQLIQQIQQQQRQQYPATQNTFAHKPAMYQFPAPNLSLANMTFIQSQLKMQAQGPQGPSAAALTGNIQPRYAPVAISPAAGPFKPQVPAFQAMPSSVSRISTGQIVHLDLNRKGDAVNPNSIYSTNVKREVCGFILHIC